MAQDTIVAIATAQGRGAIGVVRASGPAVPALMRQICGRDLSYIFLRQTPTPEKMF